MSHPPSLQPQVVTAVHNRFGLLTNFSLGVTVRLPKREEVGRDGTHLLPKMQEEGGHAQAQGCHAEGQALGSPGRMRALQDHGPLGWRSLVVQVIRDKRSE